MFYFGICLQPLQLDKIQLNETSTLPLQIWRFLSFPSPKYQVQPPYYILQSIHILFTLTSIQHLASCPTSFPIYFLSLAVTCTPIMQRAHAGTSGSVLLHTQFPKLGMRSQQALTLHLKPNANDFPPVNALWRNPPHFPNFSLPKSDSILPRRNVFGNLKSNVQVINLLPITTMTMIKLFNYFEFQFIYK